jgi:hypothetical protein
VPAVGALATALHGATAAAPALAAALSLRLLLLAVAALRTALSARALLSLLRGALLLLASLLTLLLATTVLLLAALVSSARTTHHRLPRAADGEHAVVKVDVQIIFAHAGHVAVNFDLRLSLLRVQQHRLGQRSARHRHQTARTQRKTRR